VSLKYEIVMQLLFFAEKVVRWYIRNWWWSVFSFSDGCPQ